MILHKWNNFILLNFIYQINFEFNNIKSPFCKLQSDNRILKILTSEYLNCLKQHCLMLKQAYYITLCFGISINYYSIVFNRNYISIMLWYKNFHICKLKAFSTFFIAFLLALIKQIASFKTFYILLPFFDTLILVSWFYCFLIRLQFIFIAVLCVTFFHFMSLFNLFPSPAQWIACVDYFHFKFVAQYFALIKFALNKFVLHMNKL